MQENSPGRRGKARILTEEYNHSLGKLIGTKRRVKPSRKAAFMAAFPVKASPRLHSDEEGASVQSRRDASVNHSEHGETSTTEETISKAGVKSPVDVRQKLQVFVRGLLLPKTLCLQVDPETPVSDLKALVERESGIQPENQHLYIGRNFQLCDLLSIRDHGIQQDQNIKLRAGGLLGGGLLEEEPSRNIYFLNLSRELGPHWEKLAIHLRFSVSELDTFIKNYPQNSEQQSFRMLDTWWKKQDNPADAPEKLRGALKAIDRADLALQTPDIRANRKDVAETSFEVKLCARELAAHYRETMKVTTHPTERHLSREMEDIYVKPLLLHETNIPTPVSTSQTKMQLETGSQSMHSKASKRGTSDPLRSQAYMDKGIPVQKIPLDSYEDMLKLKGNRLLVIAEAGLGKTTLLKKIAYDWADLKTGDQTEKQQQPERTSVLGRYELVFVVEVNQMGETFDIIDAIFSQIITDRKLRERFEGLEKYIIENPERVLILLDGADEISFQRLKVAQCKSGISLNDVVSFKTLKSCKVIVTSRQKTANEQLLSMHEHFTKINIVGFDEEYRAKYARKYLTNFKTDDQNRFLARVNGSETLRSLAEIPLFLWLMCHTWAHEDKLPDQITSLFQDNMHLLYQHKTSKETEKQVSDTQTDVSKLGMIALEGLLDPNGEMLHFSEDKIDSKDLHIFKKGSDVGLLSKRKIFRRLETVSYFSFLHKTFQEYCAAAFLVDLSRTDESTFDQYLSRILHGDVETLEYVLIFCCGLDKIVAEKILRRIEELLRGNKMNKSLHKILMLLLFEAQSESLVKCFVETGKVDFPYELRGEVLVATHYFFEVGSKHKTLHNVDIEIVSAACLGLADFILLENIMTHIQCKPSLILELTRISLDSFVDNSTETLRYLKTLHIRYCDWNLVKLFEVLSKNNTQIMLLGTSGTISLDTVSKQNIEILPCLQQLVVFDSGLTKSDIEPLFILLSAAGSINTVVLTETDLHGLQPIEVTAVPSLSSLHLYECGLTHNDIEPLFSLLSAAGSIETLVLRGNNLHNLQPINVAVVPSLSVLHLGQCGLTKTDINALFSLLSAVGSVKKCILMANNLHGLQPAKFTAVSSLTELHLHECNLTKSDIESLFFLLSAAGSIKGLFLKGNNLHGLKSDNITNVPSLSALQLDQCGLAKSDIESLFSLLSASGSIKTLFLNGDNLQGLRPVNAKAVPSLTTIRLHQCGLTNTDIEALFSLLSAAGSIKTLFLSENGIHGLRPMNVSAVSSLSEIHFEKCGLTNTDIDPILSLLKAAGSIKKCILTANNLHGLQTEKNTAVPSLTELHLHECNLTESDIAPLFVLLSAAGSIRTVALTENNLHGLQPTKVTAVPSLSSLHLYECGLTHTDIEPLFSLLSAAGSIKKLVLIGNKLHGLRPMHVTAVLSLSVLQVEHCGLTNTDIDPFFSLLTEVGSIKKCILVANNLHGLQPAEITAVPSLTALQLNECNLTKSDIEPLFILLSAAGSIKSVTLTENNLHGLQPIGVTAVPSLSSLHLYESGLTHSDIEPLFSLLSSAGSVNTLFLRGNNLQGLRPMHVTAIPSLSVLQVEQCGLTSTDIDPFFSLLTAVGSIKECILLANNLHGLQVAKIAAVPSLRIIQLYECNLTKSDIDPLFILLSAAGSIKTVTLSGNNIHGLQPIEVTAVPSLSSLHLYECGLTHKDIKSLFSLVAAAGSIKTLFLRGNNLHRLRLMNVTAVPSLSVLQVEQCGLTNTDIDQFFSLLSAVGSVKKCILIANNLHGLQPSKVTAVPSLTELQLHECYLTKSDIEPLCILISSAGSIKTIALTGSNLQGLQSIKVTAVPSLSVLQLDQCGLANSDIDPFFSVLTSAGSIKKCVLLANNLHGLKPSKITAVSSLTELQLHECYLTKSDIDPLFILLSAAGSIKSVTLTGNNLHGLQPIKVTAVPSLSSLHIYECCLTQSDIESLFSLVSSAGSIKKLFLRGNNLHGLQPIHVTAVLSLSYLQLQQCGLTNTDIDPLFSLLSAVGSVKKCILIANNLHGLQPSKITAVPSLTELQLQECNLTASDIEPLFVLLSAAGNIMKVALTGNNLHGLQPIEVNAVPFLSELYLYKCGLTNADIEPLFSLLSSAGNTKRVVLKGNNFHGLSQVSIHPLPSLRTLDLSECGLQNSDIGEVFRLLSSLGHVVEFHLNDNSFQSNAFEALAFVPSLELVFP
ncbi:protein NLRC5-like [Patiria miniata]|uniref:Uncharacterized protein n=1 Tax=Patiria miniata TaxID=46514 RepID=A0A913Z6G1_PATMI|nr:protein NLRC5-like [Patiria miniata]XP_038047307.1 protein NLRC5-like [Patiria miniata]